MNRILFSGILAFAILFDAPRSLAQNQPASLWDHNTSTMGLYANGASRVFRYEHPRQGMQDEGVISGTIRFSGVKSGNAYSGTAYVFSRRCGAHPYPVTGTISADERTIVLHGKAPSGFDSNCRPVTYREQDAHFTFLQALTAPAPVVQIDSGPSPEFAERDEREKTKLAELRAQQGELAADLRKLESQVQAVRRDRAREEQRLNEVRTYAKEFDACRRYNMTACTSALKFTGLVEPDTAMITTWRRTAEQAQTDLNACLQGTPTACDNALRSPALSEAERSLIAERRPFAASPVQRSIQSKDRTLAPALVATNATSTPAVMPTAPVMLGMMGTMLALALAGLAYRYRRLLPRQPTRSAPPVQRVAVSASMPASNPDDVLVTPKPNAAGEQQPAPSALSLAPLVTPPASPQRLRDTPAALEALELAHAYIEEVREADLPDLEDEVTRKQHLNALSLASKQLAVAERCDPDAVLEGEDKNGVPYRWSCSELKAEALFIEGLTHQTYDLKRAIPALTAATLIAPNDPRAFYALGITQAANKNKRAAVAALGRAVALDPKNITYRKDLDRARNVSGAEIAGYKITRAGERIYDAGITTANAGIRAWNIFAITWNILTFPVRIVLKFYLFVFRILGFPGFR